jgi:HPt (histidine-containing phosphotransfer) domain-containing protein
LAGGRALIARDAHALKGASGAFGFAYLSGLSLKLERTAADIGEAGYEAPVDEIERTSELTAAASREFKFSDTGFQYLAQFAWDDAEIALGYLASVMSKNCRCAVMLQYLGS